MVRLVLFLLLVAALATGLAWLADRPGELVVNWQGYELQTSVFRAVVLFTVLLGALYVAVSLVRQLWQSPATVGQIINRRRQKKGLEALSTGMIAIGAGDRATATRYAIQARKSLPNEPLTHLLRAQAAQLSGDKATARRIFEAMLGSPDTEQLGLRGLFLEAEREGESEAARQFAARAVRLNPKLGWPVDALFDLQCKQKDWAGALDTLAIAKRNGTIERPMADRRRAVLLTAQAQDLEEADPEKALALAQEAHGLSPELVPAAAVAGRLLASRGSTGKATKIIQKTWSRGPHPDLAAVYAYARLGDSPRDRLDRIKQLAALTPNSIESPIAIATTAIEARDFELARKVLEPLATEGRMTHRACLLMARAEGEQNGDRGRVREWLARALHAQRDPAWTADGVVSDRWAAVSPVTGQLDAFQWRVPVENIDKGENELLAAKLEELVALGAPSAAKTETVIDATPVAAAKSEGAKAAPAPVKTPVRETAVRDADVIEVEAVETSAKPAAATRDATGGRPALREATVTVKPSVKPSAPAATVSEPVKDAPVAAAKPIAQPQPQPQPAAAPAKAAAPATPAPAAAAPAEPQAKAAVAAPAAASSAGTPVSAAVTPGASKAPSAETRTSPAQQPVAQQSSTKPTPQPTLATAKPGAASTNSQRTTGGKDGKAQQPRMIVPDDPGLGDDDDLPKSPLRSLRAGS